MRIGIDFGTTRIVVAAADRGNYPLVNFEAADGRIRDWFPSLVAVKGNSRVYGWEAVGVQGTPGWITVRSLKRWLKDAGPSTEIEISGQSLSLSLLLTEMMAALRSELVDRSNLGAGLNDRLEVMLGVPANANSNQRFLTEEVARAAGFVVLGLSNEPSAAAIEFAYRNSADRKRRAQGGLLVYDLGGGTFDVSLVDWGETEHSVVASDGIPDLGGDDFDELLADLALEAAAIPSEERDALTSSEWLLLVDECREKKESLNPNSRKVTVDLERVRNTWKEVTIGVDLYYERCKPLIESSRRVVESLLAAHPQHSIDTLYVTGGGSELPPVARILRETFGRRVRRSAYMRSATAIGLAIRADTHQRCVLHEQFTQNFGVWREADEGRNVVFDRIFPRGMKLPHQGEPPLRTLRVYRPVHNIGHFRYLECAHLDDAGEPQGEMTNWDDIRVPFDPKLQSQSKVADLPITQFVPNDGMLIEEAYTCDSSGNVAVRISDSSTNHVREYRLGHWSKSKMRGATR